MGAGLGWAGSVLLAPPDELPPPDQFSVVTADEGSVGRSISLNARAAWMGAAPVSNLAQGTVTRVHVSGATLLRPGDALFDVELVPVRVVEGAVPAFRPMRPGIVGADVRQLQRFLQLRGFRISDPDGEFDSFTAAQVSAWQAAVGRAPVGEVPLGELLFVPKLPAVVALGEDIVVGSVVGPAAAASTSPEVGTVGQGIRILPSSPTFSISLPENQAGLVRSGMRVVLERREARWRARIGNVATPDPEGTFVAQLRPIAGSKICESECREIPLAGDAAISATIELVRKNSGVVVPAAALIVGDAGSPAVLDEDGDVLPVDVVVSSGGRAVVEGIEVGQEIRVPGDVTQ